MQASVPDRTVAALMAIYLDPCLRDSVLSDALTQPTGCHTGTADGMLMSAAKFVPMAGSSAGACRRGLVCGSTALAAAAPPPPPPLLLPSSLTATF